MIDSSHTRTGRNTTLATRSSAFGNPFHAGSLLALLISLVSGGVALAQSPQVEVGQSQAAGMDAGPMVDVSSAEQAAISDSDYREDYGEQKIISRRMSFEPWEVGIDNQFYFTDNVALVPLGEQEDWFYRGGVNIAYTQKVWSNLFVQARVSEYLYRYDRFDVLDFDLLNANVGLFWVEPRLFGITFFANYDMYRLNDGGDWGDELFINHSGIIGAQKQFAITAGLSAYAGFSSNLSAQADPDINQRSEHSVYGGCILKFTDQLETRVGLRQAYYDYDEFGRDDWNTVVDLGVTYRPLPMTALSAGMSYSYNQSNFGRFDYQAWNVGAGVRLEVKF